MSKINSIQNAILQLEGGAFQSLIDEYLYKKYQFDNIQTLGVETGTNKPTKGVPDSFVLTKDKKYILINYGSVKERAAEKIKKDILSCFDNAKLNLEESKIEKIICVYTSTNLHIEQFSEIMNIVKNVEIQLLGIDTISYDLALKYPGIAYDHLNISLDTHQIFDIDDFVKSYDANGINSPIDVDFYYRESELNEVVNSIKENKVTLVTGPSGIGKTRLVLEACRVFFKDGWNTYCIKNNGQLLYDDLRFYISDPGKYLLFFDDANNFGGFENILNYITEFTATSEIKLVFTIRDYAKERVKKSTKTYFALHEIVLEGLKSDEVKEILKKNLGIVNDLYLQRIAEVAKGNIRLAMLAGLKSVKDGLVAIQNAEDIFSNYYKSVFEKSELGKNELLMIFLTTFFGPIRYKENTDYLYWIEKLGINNISEEIIERLYSIELLDWFRGEIVKVSDQSFGNYILYYVLFEKRWIQLSSFIKMIFPTYKNKLIYALNTLISLFGGAELMEFIKDEVNVAWKDAREDLAIDFVECFYQLNLEKALVYLKEFIDKEESSVFDLKTFNFNREKNYSRIKMREIKILAGFKNTEYFEDAIDLLLIYYKKRPDYIMDIYFAITERMLYDKQSYSRRYQQENILIQKLWAATEMGANYNNTILFIHVAEKALQSEVSFTEEGETPRSMSFVRMTIVVNDATKAIREKIFTALFSLYEIAKYRKLVLSILQTVHGSGLKPEQMKELIQSDYKLINNYFKNRDTLNFEEAKIFGEYKKQASFMDISLPDINNRLNENREYQIYHLLTKEHIRGRTIEEDELERKNEIRSFIYEFSIEDYQRFFDCVAYIEEKCPNEAWMIGTGIEAVFEILCERANIYIDVFKEYLKADAPFGRHMIKTIPYMVHAYGYEEIISIIKSISFKDQDWWVNNVFENLPPSMVTKENTLEYKHFLETNFTKEEPLVPRIYSLEKYAVYNAELPIYISNIILSKHLPVHQFLGTLFRSEEITYLGCAFKSNMDILKKLYFNGLDPHFDFYGELFLLIFDDDKTVWKQYLEWLKMNLHRNEYRSGVFEKIWKEDNYIEYINLAVETLLPDKYFVFNENAAKTIFPESEKRLQEMKERQRRWFEVYIRRNYQEIEKIRLVISVANVVCESWKLELILLFLSLNKSYSDFQKLYLFPLSSSWSGSEIPFIDKRILFLGELKQSLKGIDYIQHRDYLNDRIEALQSYRKKVELSEYIENIDYA